MNKLLTASLVALSLSVYAGDESWPNPKTNAGKIAPPQHVIEVPEESVTSDGDADTIGILLKRERDISCAGYEKGTKDYVICYSR